MEYTDLKLYDFSRLDGSLQDFNQKGRREAGLHVSGLVRAAYKGIFNEEKGGIEGEQPFVRAMAGFLWERSLENAFTEYMGVDRAHVSHGITLDKQLADGRKVFGSPDGIDMNTSTIEEYKATWRSMRKWGNDPEREFWMWVAQVKAYCYMIGFLKARFFVFWVNGDYTYKTGRGPQVTTCDLTFTQDELDDNWRVLLAHSKEAKLEH